MTAMILVWFRYQVPEIRDNLLRRYDGKWKKIAKQQMKFFFNPSNAEIQEQARRYVCGTQKKKEETQQGSGYQGNIFNINLISMDWTKM